MMSASPIFLTCDQNSIESAKKNSASAIRSIVWLLDNSCLFKVLILTVSSKISVCLCA